MTPTIEISVVVPTRDRPRRLATVLACLREQTLGLGHEVIVVDDGSEPAVRDPGEGRVALRIVRLEGEERSVARNAGADLARGRLLVFLDDDGSFGGDLLEKHWSAFSEWPDALLVGAVRLPPESERTPFGRFRAALERRTAPARRGPVTRADFCTAANMGVARTVFRRLGGFDPQMVSAEDQDFALRHIARGGRVAYLPEAVVVHHDDALDLRRYCARAEWGMRNLAEFCRRHPDRPENVARERVNGAIRFGLESPSTTLRKLVKDVLATATGTRLLLAVAERLEAVVGDGPALRRVYELALGVHLRRGYRRGQNERGHLTESREENSPLRRAV